MGKRMARIQDSHIATILWCSDVQPESDTLIDVTRRPVKIGDEYDPNDHNFYRDNQIIYTQEQELMHIIEESTEALATIRSGTNG